MQSETFTVHLARQSRGQVMLREGKAPEPDARPRVPMRAARLMAMAIRIDGLVRSGDPRPAPAPAPSRGPPRSARREPPPASARRSA